MKLRPIVIATTLTLVLLGGATLEVGAEGQKTLAATMDVFVFPTEGQDSGTQSVDEAACYNWAVENAGTDPFQLAKDSEATAKQAEQAKADAKQAGKGAGAKGALGGAAAGALIGEIANDDAGKGAAYGAAAGAIAMRRRAKRSEKKVVEQADQQVANTQQYTQEALDNFKKAFSVCLEAKTYMVKY
jgi:hypothetical protein